MAYTTAAKTYLKCGLTSSDIAEATVTTFIGWADDLIERRTGKKWSSPASYSELFDIKEIIYNKDSSTAGGYTVGQIPHFNKYNTVFLKNKPVTQINSVFLLYHGTEISLLYSFDTSESTYTDNTTEANSVRGTPFYAFAETVEVGDCLYVGSSYRFTGLDIQLSTSGVGGVLVWEYYNGSSWSSLSVTESDTGADDLNASGNIYWTLPSDWQETSVNSSGDYYWIRARVSTAHSTSPKLNNIFFRNNNVIGDELSGYEYQWRSTGRFIVTGKTLGDNFQYLEVNYKAGASATPTAVENLSTNLAAQQIILNLMTASYNDVTRERLGDEEYATGEQYIHLKTTLAEFKEEEKMLWEQIGKRVRFFA